MIGEVVKSALSVPAISAYVGTRVFPDTFMQKDGGLPQWPSIRYTLISAASSEDVCGTDDESTDDTRVQLDVVATTNRERALLVTAVIAAMQNLDPPASRDNLIRTFDEPTRTYRAILDFIFYPSSEETP